MKTAEATSVDVRAECARVTGRLACAEKCRIAWAATAEDIMQKSGWLLYRRTGVYSVVVIV